MRPIPHSADNIVALAQLPAKRKPRQDHRGTLLLPFAIVSGWALLLGYYHIALFILAQLGRVP